MTARLPDPVVDTPMIVTLDELRAYEYDPRVNRNPRYDKMRASILRSGLDAPPPITRRPGEAHFIIRNGGNTRLAILKDLWRETQDEQFFRLQCLFRPWPARGEVVALAGHLKENDLRGGLTFIERALGVERLKALYEQELEAQLSQRELARHLMSDGYPVSQSHISKMQDTVRYLLPAIPKTLYAGLGKPQIEKLIALLRSSERVWFKHLGARADAMGHVSLFQETLALFDQGGFSYERFQDELVYKMGQRLGQDYSDLKLDLLEPERQVPQQRALGLSLRSPSLPLPLMAGQIGPATDQASRPSEVPASSNPVLDGEAVPPVRLGEPERSDGLPFTLTADEPPTDLQGHMGSTIPQRMPFAEVIGPLQASDDVDAVPGVESMPQSFVAMPADEPNRVEDLGEFEGAADDPEGLRQVIFGLVRDIADEVALTPEFFCASDQGIGFRCVRQVGWGTDSLTVTPEGLTPQAHILLILLEGLSDGCGLASGPAPLRGNANLALPFEMPSDRFAVKLGQLLLGGSPFDDQPASRLERLSDVALIKLFRVIRLARRLIERQEDRPVNQVI
ncbi:ParB family protein [Pseudomonas batumici]|uniref:ParB family protein n=1 Tax=Pseudomonas batumici TaxID=226910 RepID=UPI0030D11FF4